MRCNNVNVRVGVLFCDHSYFRRGVCTRVCVAFAVRDRIAAARILTLAISLQLVRLQQLTSNGEKQVRNIRLNSHSFNLYLEIDLLYSLATLVIHL